MSILQSHSHVMRETKKLHVKYVKRNPFSFDCLVVTHLCMYAYVCVPYIPQFSAQFPCLFCNSVVKQLGNLLIRHNLQLVILPMSKSVYTLVVILKRLLCHVLLIQSLVTFFFPFGILCVSFDHCMCGCVHIIRLEKFAFLRVAQTSSQFYRQEAFVLPFVALIVSYYLSSYFWVQIESKSLVSLYNKKVTILWIDMYCIVYLTASVFAAVYRHSTSNSKKTSVIISRYLIRDKHISSLRF